MPFDYNQCLQQLKLSYHDADALKFIHNMIAFGQQLRPHPAWASFLDLDYLDQLASDSDILTQQLSHLDPDFQVKGIWFGLGERTELPYSMGVSMLAFSNYSAHPALCWIDYHQAHYDFSGITACNLLERIEAMSEHSPLKNQANYLLPLAYGIQLALQTMQKFHRHQPHLSVAASVGYEDGDFIDLGYVKK